jgi:hypothetical protein
MDDFAILHVRLANSAERALYCEQAASRSGADSMLMAYLVAPDIAHPVLLRGQQHQINQIKRPGIV